MLGYNQQAVTWRAASSSAGFSRPVSAPLSLQGVMRLDRQINQRAGGSGSRAFRPGPFARVNEAARRSAAAAGGRDRVRGTGAAGVRPCLSRRIGMPGCGPTRALATRQGNLRNPSANALNLVCYWPPHHSMNNFFLPTLNILPSWGPVCPDSSSFCTLSSSGQEKGCFGVGLGPLGVFCTCAYS